MISISSYKFPLLIIAIAISSFQSTPQKVNEITLQDEPLSFIPKEFYVADVIDERADRSVIALLLSGGDLKGGPPKIQPVDLKGGGGAAVKKFIIHNLQRNTTLRPIVIKLKTFKAIESVLQGNKIEGQISLSMSFYLERGSEEEMVYLSDYIGNADYTRNGGHPYDIEPTLRNLLKDGLQKINTWMNKQAATDIRLAKGVKVSFTDYEEKSEGDSIYYNVKRPLAWSDFQSKIPNSRYEAEVFPSFGYDERTSIANAIINLNLIIKVCLPKSASWAKEGSRSAYTLNHEQRHFDIVKIVAEHFKQKLRTENLSTTNYDGPINEDYLDAYREMNNLQKQYDDETHHGTDEYMQQKWNERIDKGLREIGVK